MNKKAKMTMRKGWQVSFRSTVIDYSLEQLAMIYLYFENSWGYDSKEVSNKEVFCREIGKEIADNGKSFFVDDGVYSKLDRETALRKIKRWFL